MGLGEAKFGKVEKVKFTLEQATKAQGE